MVFNMNIKYHYKYSARTVSIMNIEQDIRNNTVKHLCTHFDKKYCKDIEDGIYNFSIQYCTGTRCHPDLYASVYNHKCDDILFNCSKGNKTMDIIRGGMKDGLFNPYNIAFLKPEELNKDCWESIIVRMINTEEKLSNLPSVEWRRCKSCHGNEYFLFNLQTRSGDEPETSFYICKNKKCRRMYKVNN